MKFSTAFLLVIAFLSIGLRANAQTNPTPDNLVGQDNAITTAVPFLAISPDARHSALGDAGVATSADANSAYWNAAKLVFIDKQYGGSLSYTPWLGKIVNDMSISYLTGFYKINREQVVSFGIKYFDLGDINFKDINGVSQGDFNPREFAFEGTYSRMLTEEFSIGGSARYIYSNLTGAFSGNDAKPGRSVAADIGLFYKHEIKKSTRNSTLAFGLSISNIGAKISYTNSSVREDFLPINLRLGSAFTTEVDPYNKFTFALDFNKLMVPTPPGDPDESLLGGMFGSFSDASAEEELREIMICSGIEYWYNNTFAARLGYFYEDKTKGNRKYLTVGVGFRKNNFGLDVAYLVPTNKRDHPLAETLRFTLLLQIGKTSDQEESVTD
jgi:hypothetical protein